MDEARKMLKSWWCQGGGMAVLMLLATVIWFRDGRDLIFWAAIAFFVAHTALAVGRYVVDRRSRTTATVIRHHDSHYVDVTVPPFSFIPMPIASLIRLDLVPPKIISPPTTNNHS